MGAFDHIRAGQLTQGCKSRASSYQMNLLFGLNAKAADYGNHTSTIDWCELNYTHSPYIAEFYNTLTNLPSILLGIWGCYGTLRGGVRKRYALGYLGLTGIGLGSFGFHASLKWEWQLLDELPMVSL